MRAAIPKSATNPTIEPKVRVPPVSATATTPPMSVLGNESNTSITWRILPKERASSSTINTKAAPEWSSSSFVAERCTSAAPP